MHTALRALHMLPLPTTLRPSVLRRPAKPSSNVSAVSELSDAPPAGEHYNGGRIPAPDDAAGVILRALELGVSCLDTAPDWGPFENERLIGARAPSWRGQTRAMTCQTIAGMGSFRC